MEMTIKNCQYIKQKYISCFYLFILYFLFIYTYFFHAVFMLSGLHVQIQIHSFYLPNRYSLAKKCTVGVGSCQVSWVMLCVFMFLHRDSCFILVTSVSFQIPCPIKFSTCVITSPALTLASASHCLLLPLVFKLCSPSLPCKIVFSPVWEFLRFPVLSLWVWDLVCFDHPLSLLGFF